MNNKPLLLLTLLCGFLLGVIAGPWLWPRDLIQTPAMEPAISPPQAAIEPPAPPPPAPVPVAISSEPEMQLKGVFIVGDGTRSVALIQTGDGQPQPYRVDQKLPNEYVVKTIAKNTVEVEKNGETVNLPLVRASKSSVEENPEAEVVAPAAADAPVAEPENAAGLAAPAPSPTNPAAAESSTAPP